jgi:hypothetical protein
MPYHKRKADQPDLVLILNKLSETVISLVNQNKQTKHEKTQLKCYSCDQTGPMQVM